MALAANFLRLSASLLVQNAEPLKTGRFGLTNFRRGDIITNNIWQRAMIGSVRAARKRREGAAGVSFREAVRKVARERAG